MTSSRILRSLALSVLLACTASGAARAAPPDAGKPEPPSGADERATLLLGAGNKAFREGRFDEAEQAYREAFALKKGYDVSGNLGAAELSLGKLRDCAQHLGFTLRTFPITGEPALREQMARAFEQCRRGVGAVRIDLEVPGATLLIDGVPAGEGTFLDQVFVDPGEHVFEARKDGYTGSPRRVTVEKGGSVEVTLPLVPLPPPVKTVVRVVPAHRRSLAPGLGLASVAALGIVGGAVLTGVSASKRSDARALSGQILAHRGNCVAGAPGYDTARCPTLQSTLRADDALHDVAVGAFVAGGAAAAGALLYFLWPQRAPSTGRTLDVTPIAGARDGGVVLSGSF